MSSLTANKGVHAGLPILEEYVLPTSLPIFPAIGHWGGLLASETGDPVGPFLGRLVSSLLRTEATRSSHRLVTLLHFLAAAVITRTHAPRS
jgi:hypothetical protein